MPGLTDVEQRQALCMGDLSGVLWRERTVFDRVLFLLERQDVLLRTDAGNWTDEATRQVVDATDDLRQAELVRSVQTYQVTSVLGLPEAAMLRHIAAAASSPWSLIISEHRSAMCGTRDAIVRLTVSAVADIPALDGVVAAAQNERMTLRARLSALQVTAPADAAGTDYAAGVDAVSDAVPPSLALFLA